MVVVGNSCWTILVRPSTSLGFMPMPVACGQEKPYAAWMLLQEKEIKISKGGMPCWVVQPRPSSA